MDDLKNLLKGLLYLGLPLGLSLVSNWLTEKRNAEVMQVTIEKEVQKQLQLLLQAPKS